MMFHFDADIVRIMIQEYRTEHGRDPISMKVPLTVVLEYFEWIIDCCLEKCYPITSGNMFFVPCQVWDKDWIEFVDPLVITKEWEA